MHWGPTVNHDFSLFMIDIFYNWFSLIRHPRNFWYTSLALIVFWLILFLQSWVHVQDPLELDNFPTFLQFVNSSQLFAICQTVLQLNLRTTSRYLCKLCFSTAWSCWPTNQTLPSVSVCTSKDFNWYSRSTDSATSYYDTMSLGLQVSYKLMQSWPHIPVRLRANLIKFPLSVLLPPASL